MVVRLSTTFTTSADYSATSLNRTLSKPKTCLNQTDFTVPSTKSLCNLNLCKPNTCLNWTNFSVPTGFGLDRFYCTNSGVSIPWSLVFCVGFCISLFALFNLAIVFSVLLRFTVSDYTRTSWLFIICKIVHVIYIAECSVEVT